MFLRLLMFSIYKRLYIYYCLCKSCCINVYNFYTIPKKVIERDLVINPEGG